MAGKKTLSPQETLLSNEQRFRILIESIKDYAIFMLDNDGNVATWNSGAKNLKFYDASEIIGKHFSIFYPEEDIRAKKPARELKEAREVGKFEEEGWRLRKDGTTFWANVIITPLNDDDGNPIGFAKITRDLTERRNAEISLLEANAELQRSRAFLDSMIENLPNMVFVKDARDLRFIRFNRAGEDLIGQPRSVLIGKNDYDLFPRAQADFFTSKDRAVLAGKSVVDIPEETIETARGQRILHTRKIPIAGPDSKPEYLLGISEDITEWKNAEAIRLEALREQAALKEREIASRQMLFLADASTLLASTLNYRESLKKLASLVVPSLADWCTITLVDEAGKNDRIAAVHAQPEKAILIDRLQEFYPVDSDRTDGIRDVIRTGQSRITKDVRDEDLKRSAKDGTHLEILRELGCTSAMLVPLAFRGKVLGAISFVSSDRSRIYDAQDVSLAEEIGRRAAVAIDNAFLYEAAQRAIRARDEFLSIASHELKTPVTSLKLQLQMARRSTRPEENLAPTPEKLAKVLDTSNAQVIRLTALIDDLLDISRIESGKLSFHFESVDLSQLTHEIVDRFIDHLTAAGCAVTLKADEKFFIRADRFRVEQVLLNLLSNVAKYSPGKPVEVRVEATAETVLLICEDRGMGIPKDKLEKIFERFERVVPSESTSGLGLGLYITREIVKAHGGTIRAESEMNQGTKFTVRFPRISSPV